MIHKLTGKTCSCGQDFENRGYDKCVAHVRDSNEAEFKRLAVELARMELSSSMWNVHIGRARTARELLAAAEACGVK